MGTLNALTVFHPLVRSWFATAFGQPTDTQAQAWPRIAAGEHVLVTAPTGSGKTLTAFLWALDRLLTGAWAGDGVQVLYVSPLRALNTDIHRNLERPLRELTECFRASGQPIPAIRSLTRSSDTPEAERRRMLRQPPEILITTPESLNLLLTSANGRRLFTQLKTVILDEIHAVAASKRGTHLITAVDRLVPLAGEFQRLALSATIRPLERIAEFVGGYQLRELDGEFLHRPRPVTILRSPQSKRYAVRVRAPVGTASLDDESLWPLLVADFKEVIRRNRATLFFANSRRLVERVTRLINADEPADLVYSHHGSLSREVRAVVEARLKQGELAGIVATNSLELGIDIGSLDEVVLVQTPRSVAGAVQRVGRAGHGVGEVSRGTFYPTFGRDLLEAALVARSLTQQEIEPVRPIELALDVLAQVVLSMLATEDWQLDDLLVQLRTSFPFRRLSLAQLELVLEMLAGRYAQSRIRELNPRISLDRVTRTVRVRPGVRRLLFQAGGTIPDRGYFTLRLEGSLAKLGELDEEFVWERSLGDTFTLGTQSWQVQQITHNEVVVAPARGAAMAPFWRADAQDRGHFLSAQIGAFLAVAEEQLDNPQWGESLEREFHLEPAAAEALIAYLKEQRAATAGFLPHHRQVICERLADPLERSPKRQLIFHTFWGGTVNRPLALALAAAWEEKFSASLEVFQDDDCILLRTADDCDPHDLLALVDPEKLELLLRKKLENSGFFGARFRVNAATALLLPRTGLGHRTPLWLTRLRAKRLGEAVAPYGDFPILLETWRTCLEDEFDLENLRRLLTEVSTGEIVLREVTTTTPSPFAAGLLWQQTNSLMYEDDAPSTQRTSSLRQDVLQEILFQARLRPRLPAALCERLRQKVQRVLPGYAPGAGDELVDWIGERVLLTRPEWQELIAAVVRENPGLTAAQVVDSVSERVAWVSWGEAAAAMTLERLVQLETALTGQAGVPAAVPADCAAPAEVPVVGAIGDPAAAVPADCVAAVPAGQARVPAAVPADCAAPAEVPVVGTIGDPAEPLPPAAQARLAILRRAMADPAGEREERGPELVELVAEWLRFQGPLLPAQVQAAWGLAEPQWRRVLSQLVDTQEIVLDPLRQGSEELELCDRENLEILLRWLRLEARPSFVTRKAAELPLFFAVQHKLAPRGEGIEGLKQCLEQLLGYPAPAAAWEAEMLPARLDPYYSAWLDALLQESELLWWGCGKERLSFAFPEELDLLREPASDAPAEEAVNPQADSSEPSSNLDPIDAGAAARTLFPNPSGKYELADLAQLHGQSTAVLSDQLWQLTWQGQVTNSSFATVRKGLATQFRVADLPLGVTAGRRSGFNRWQATRPFFGQWSRLPPPAVAGDALSREELIKERIRLLLARHGLLFRELLARELPLLRWPQLFRTLRLLELSGEVLAGHFFAGIRGLQFMSQAAFRCLQRGLPEDAIYWLNATDPASLCGVEVEGLKGDLPARLITTHLVFHGTRCVLTSRRNGRQLEIKVSPEDPHLAAYCRVFKVLLTRDFQPLKVIEVKTINGEAAANSPYCRPFSEIFRLTREQQTIKLWKRY